MLARALSALLLVAFAPGCKRPRPPVAADGGTVEAPAPRSDGPTIVQCGPTVCPPDGATPPRDGGELVVHVEAEPAILCDLVEHDAWSRWIAENQIMETLLYQDPWSGKITPRLAASFELTAEAL